MRGWLAWVSGAAVAALLLAGCGTAAGSGTTRPGGPPASSSTTQAPKPAGPVPSKIATMVCSKVAQKGIGSALGETAEVSPPTWIAHLYSCRYRYPTGSFTLSVQELSSWSQTLSYFHRLAHKMGDTGVLRNLGQGAFTTSNGSVVVRKDWKVLLVDVSSLPANFGKPATTRADVAITISDIILGCWAGD